MTRFTRSYLIGLCAGHFMILHDWLHLSFITVAFALTVWMDFQSDESAKRPD